MRLHSQVQRAQSTVDQEAVERPGTAPIAVLNEAQPLVAVPVAAITAPPTTSE